MAQTAGTEAPPETHAAQVGDENVQRSSSRPDAAAPDLPARRKRRIPPAVIVIALIALVVGAVLTWLHYSTNESTDDAQVDGHINPISARVGGYVTQVNVTDNQYVEAGTVLAQIDPKDYQVRVDQAKAELAEAQAAANAARQNVPITSINTASQTASAQADIENAKAAIAWAQQQTAMARAQQAQAVANNKKSQSDLERYKQLIAKEEISSQQYDQAVATAAASAAGVDAANAAVDAAQHQVAQAQAKLVSAQASYRATTSAPQQVAVSEAHFSSADATLQQKQAALEQAELNLQYCTIMAPAAGVVNKNIEVGMNVQAGQQLMSIVEVNDVWITANFKETQLRHMRVGQTVEISSDAYGRKYKGHVDSIAGASGSRFSLLPPENASGNYVKVVQRVPVKIVLEQGQNSDHLLRPGMSVEPEVHVK